MPEFASPQKKPQHSQPTVSGLLQRKTTTKTPSPTKPSLGVGHDFSKIPATTRPSEQSDSLAQQLMEHLWDEPSARAACQAEIESWRKSGFNFAANLFQHFLEKKGPAEYAPSSSDIEEIKTYAAKFVCDAIAEVVEKQDRQSGKVPVTISHAGKGADQDSNIRWLPLIDNKNMLYAYGGADLNVNGVAEVRDNSYWTGSFDVTLGDEYAFESRSHLKTIASSIYSKAYRAALWLETSKHGYKSFYHKAAFTLTCSGKPK